MLKLKNIILFKILFFNFESFGLRPPISEKRKKRVMDGPGCGFWKSGTRKQDNGPRGAIESALCFLLFCKKEKSWEALVI